MESKFAKKEAEILKFWQDNKIFQKTLDKVAPKSDYVFFEGPPTANAAPGVHHVLARSFKDIMPRYKTMQGYRVTRKAGWDTHGLPVELQVEKKLGIESKPEIENIVKGDPQASITKFNAECKKTVWEFKEEWEKLTERIAFWVDMSDPYITYENDYIESVWAVIKKAHERGLLYQGHKVVPFCSRCGTALSSHEVAQGYRNIEEDSVYIKCKVDKGNDVVKEGDYILTWTTTPWTLPGNVALAVGLDFDYIRVKAGDEYLIFAKDLADSIVEGEYKVEAEFKGKDLVGVSYQPLFPGAIDAVDAKDSKTAWQVVPADFVTTTDGTGVVHTAVMYGEDDYQLGEKVGLPKQHTVALDGTFLPHVEKLAGKHVKAEETTKIIFKHLKDQKLLYKIAPYAHDYPFCWRCDSPLLYYAKDSWFIKMTALQKDLLKNAKDITWVPSHIKGGRFGEWLDGIKDWAISRERYWGTPLPVWQCEKCDEIKVIGSQKELGKKLNDLHRPFIDAVTFKCQCGGEMRRLPEVMDVWLDSGSMPFAQYHYPFENQDLIDKKQQYPAQFISEAIDQTRGWFYTLLAVSTIMDKGTSYQNVICLGHINDAKGHKMSKSKGNVVDPWEVIDQYGADALRWYLFTVNQPGEPKNFDLQGVAEATKKPLILLSNVLSFYQLYNKDNKIIAPKSSNILDQWIIASLHQLLQSVDKHLDNYHVTEPARAIGDFINELSTWYVRRSRDRFKSGDQKAIQTLGYVLLELSKMMAPFTPFMADDIYRQIGGEKESVHLEDWPEVNTKLIDKKLLEGMDMVRQIVERGLAARAETGIKVRQPLASYVTVLTNKLDDELVELVKEELNIKELKFGKAEKLDTKLTDDLKLEGLSREVIRQINQLRKVTGLTINDKVVIYQAGLDEVFEKFGSDIQKATLATEVEKSLNEATKEIEGGRLGIRKLGS